MRCMISLVLETEYSTEDMDVSDYQKLSSLKTSLFQISCLPSNSWKIFQLLMQIHLKNASILIRTEVCSISYFKIINWHLNFDISLWEPWLSQSTSDKQIQVQCVGKKPISASSLHTALRTFCQSKADLWCLLVDSQLTSPDDTLTSPALPIHTSTGSTWLKYPLKPAQMEITLLIRVLSMWLKTFCEDTNHNLQRKRKSGNACFALLTSSQSTLSFCLLSSCLSGD